MITSNSPGTPYSSEELDRERFLSVLTKVEIALKDLNQVDQKDRQNALKLVPYIRARLFLIPETDLKTYSMDLKNDIDSIKKYQISGYEQAFNRLRDNLIKIKKVYSI